VTDNAGVTSTNGGTATVPFTGITVSGSVLNDDNGVTDSLINGSGTEAGSTTLTAYLVNTATNTIVGVSDVAANGGYVFNNVANGAYNVVLSNNAALTVGQSAPVASLPAGWVNTAEGTAPAGDGTANGTTAVTVNNASVTGVNFGIEQPPIAGGTIAAGQSNPGGTTSVPVPATAFTTGSSDPDGTIVSYTLTAFPSSANSITVGATTYTAATFPAGGVVLPAAQIGTVSVDPIDGSVTVGIPFKVTDNAGIVSVLPGNAQVPFTGLTLSGTVFSDPNGSKLQDGAEAGTNAGGLNAVLVNSTGQVVAVVAVSATGSYVFNNIATGTYSVLVTTGTPATGSAAPAPVLPVGYVATGENFAGAVDPISNATLTGITVSTVGVTGANFGVERPPVAGGTLAPGQSNPGGTTSVAVPATAFTTGSSDPDGTIVSYTITAFPSNATSITVGATTYTAATFPAGGIVIPAAQIGTVSVDPIDGSVTVGIPFTVTDNAGVVSPTLGNAQVPFNGISVSGSVLNDANGNTDSLVNGTGTDAASNTLTAYLVNTTTNTIVGVSDVAANGTYVFNAVANGAYNVILSNTATLAVGQPAPVSSLPAGWVSTGEGATPAGDGTANGITPVTVNNASVGNVNFGVEQRPIAGGSTAPGQSNPGGTTSVAVPATAFTTGSSDSDGTIVSYTITAFPSSANSITVGATTYTATTFPAGGIVIPAAQIGTVSVDPIDGSVTVGIPFNVTDNAGIVSATPGNASVPFTGITVSGNVLNDTNGNTDALVDGTGTDAGSATLTAYLVNTATNTVVGVSDVGANGAYIFSGVANGAYNVVLSNVATVAVGQPAPTASLPAGWVNTGEGTAPAGDGTANGITAVTVNNASVTNVNFGAEQAPVAGSTTVASQSNPGGTTSVAVPAAAFTTGSSDTAPGVIVSYVITSFPANAASITVGATTYTAATFPAGGITIPAAQIGTVSVDPIDGNVSVTIPFNVIDNAGVTSLTAGSAVIPFGQTVADLAIQKNGPASATAGSNIAYTITVINNGPGPANGTTFTDTFPAGLSNVNATCTSSAGAGTSACGTITLALVPGSLNGTVPSLPSGGSVVITVNATLPATGSLTNSVRVTPPAGVVDPVTTNNVSTVTTTIATPPTDADLSVSKVGTTAVQVGGAVGYTIDVVNAGPGPASGATFTDNVPASITAVTWTCAASGGAICPTASGSGNAISQVIATLPANGRLRYTLSGTAPAAASSVQNTASVSPPVGVTDPMPLNNTSTVNTTVTATPPTIANLAISKIGATSVAANGTITYRIVAINNGPDAANGARIVDNLPSVLTGASWTCAGSAGATCAAGSGTGNINTTVATFPNGGFVTIDVTATAPASGTFQNSATITPPAGVQDPNTTDNVGGPVITQVIVAARPDIVTTVSLSQTQPEFGQTVTATVTVGNIGGGAASNVVTTLQLPPNLSDVVVSNGGTYVSATGIVTWPAIASIGPRTNPASTFTAQFTVSQGSTALVSNATTSDPEASITNNPATVQLNTRELAVPVGPWWLIALSILAVVVCSRKRFAVR
jgi:uncharacterized repeat protein (TIGR01451 family)